MIFVLKLICAAVCIGGACYCYGWLVGSNAIQRAYRLGPYRRKSPEDVQ